MAGRWGFWHDPALTTAHLQVRTPPALLYHPLVPVPTPPEPAVVARGRALCSLGLLRRTNSGHSAILLSRPRAIHFARGSVPRCRPNGRRSKARHRNHGSDSGEPSHADGRRSFRDDTG